MKDTEKVLLAFQIGSEAGFLAGPEWQHKAIATLLGWEEDRVMATLAQLVEEGYIDRPVTYAITDEGIGLLRGRG